MAKQDIQPFEKQFTEIRKIIRQAKQRAFQTVNVELIDLFWNIGKYISIKVSKSGWGKGVVENLSDYLRRTEPGIKGFSAQNIWRMKQFYESYCDNEKLSALTRELSWTNNLLIFSKSKSDEEKEFYLRLAIQERYSSRELERQVDSGQYERVLHSGQKLSAVLREIHPDTEHAFKDNYLLDFLALPESFSEKDLRKSIVRNLKNFILEFGKDFTFVGEEYRLQVGNTDFYIDLLFFHRGLQCLVAFDLKITAFKPEYLGKMEFYLEALDRDIKKEHEKPSVGIVLCKGKDSEVVEYALSRSLSPALIAEYKTKLIDKKLLEHKLEEFFALAEESENHVTRTQSADRRTQK